MPADDGSPLPFLLSLSKHQVRLAEAESIEAVARACSAPRLISLLLRLRSFTRSQLPAISASFFALDQP